MNTITFNVSDGKQIWEQQEHDSAVRLYSLVDDWTEENEVIISQGDMVMLANLYRVIKENDIANSYINPHGNTQLSIGDDLIKALEKQIPKKPQKAKEQVVRYTEGYICPLCGKGFTGTGIADFCYHCGQALDWSEENGNK